MRLAQISDFHITKLTWNPFRLFPKRILSHLHWIAYRNEIFSKDPLEKLPDLFALLKVDLILIGGDFSSTSMPEEFALAKSITQKMGLPWIAIPGNHDTYTKKSQREKTYYQYFTNESQTFGSLAEDGVEAHQISPSWWVVSLDTSFPNYLSQGLFSEKVEKNLKLALQKIPSESKILLFNHYPFFQQEKNSRSLQRASALEKIVKDNPQIVLYLHGHTHRHSVADLRPSHFPIVLDSGSCGQTKNGFWNLIDLKETHCEITAYTWEGAWKQKNRQEFVW